MKKEPDWVYYHKGIKYIVGDADAKQLYYVVCLPGPSGGSPTFFSKQECRAYIDEYLEERRTSIQLYP